MTTYHIVNFDLLASNKFKIYHVTLVSIEFKVAHNSGIKFLKSKRIVFDNER